MHALNELRKARDEGLAKAHDPKLAFVTRSELDEFREEFRIQFAEAFQALAAAVGLGAGEEDEHELEDLGEIEEEAPAPDPAPDVHEEGRKAVEKIHARKAAKAKPEPETGAQTLEGLDS